MPADVTSVPVNYLFTMRADLKPPTVIPGGPFGTRVIFNVTGGEVSGPQVSGTIAEGGGDWVTMGSDGNARLDVRLMITTDDGVPIFVEYKGIFAPGGDGRARVTPQFQTADERYAWLNGVQAIAFGAPTESDVTYEVYALA